MKLSQVNLNTLTNAAVLVGLVYAAYQLKKLHNAGADFLAPVSGALGRAWSKLATGPGVEATYGGVILREKDFTGGTMKELAYTAQLTMHQDNAQVLQMILTPSRQLKEPYRSTLAVHGVIFVTPQGDIETGV